MIRALFRKCLQLVGQRICLLQTYTHTDIVSSSTHVCNIMMLVVNTANVKGRKKRKQMLTKKRKGNI